jgi:hypothetical protein
MSNIDDALRLLLLLLADVADSPGQGQDSGLSGGRRHYLHDSHTISRT